jgi:undecaprenyl-diphosphatase
MIIFFLLGVLVLAVMAFAAHSLAYFPGDVAISHVVQSSNSDWLDTALTAISWLGFPPQSDVLFGVIVVVLFVCGARWAAVTEALAAIGSGGLYLLLEHFVGQPRPTGDLVRVTGPIQMTGFPSGHLATFTAVFGFLAYLGYRRLQGTRVRWVPVVVAVVLVGIMGFARIYSGHHWASDVLAGCLLGGLWLAVVIRLYTWGEARLAQRRQQVTLGLPRRRAGGTSAPHAESTGQGARNQPQAG